MKKSGSYEENFTNELEEVGFYNSTLKTLTGGISSIYIAEKP